MNTISKIDPLSLAKIQGVIMFAVGLLMAILVTILSYFVPAQPTDYRLLLVSPISYGIAGFVMGGITSFLYNYVSKYVGGVKIELKK